MSRGTARAKSKKTPREIIQALLAKTIENGCTIGEEAAAVAKAEELIAKHKLKKSDFKFPPPRQQSGPKQAKTIREACEYLLTRQPSLPYEEILKQVKVAFPSAKTSIACLRFYAAKMRARGEKVPARQRKTKG